jgi:hypothetical protein
MKPPQGCGGTNTVFAFPIPRFVELIAESNCFGMTHHRYISDRLHSSLRRVDVSLKTAEEDALKIGASFQPFGFVTQMSYLPFIYFVSYVSWWGRVPSPFFEEGDYSD